MTIGVPALHFFPGADGASEQRQVEQRLLGGGDLLTSSQRDRDGGRDRAERLLVERALVAFEDLDEMP